MKKLFTITLLVSIFALGAKAQIQKGAILTGGSIGYNGQNNEREQLINGNIWDNTFDVDFLTLRPQIGFFATETLLLGIGIDYEYQYSKSQALNSGIPTSQSSNKINLFFVRPYLQKFYKITDNFFFSPSFNLLLER